MDLRACCASDDKHLLWLLLRLLWQVVECGTHTQLIAAGGLYAAMWRRQQDSMASSPELAALDGRTPAPSRPDSASTEGSGEGALGEQGEGEEHRLGV